MEFVFKPEKLSEDFFYQISEAIAKRSEILSREKFPSVFEKADKLNSKKLPEKALKRRKIFRKIYGVICVALGIFLFVPGILNPTELFAPLVMGAIAIVTGIFAVIPKKSPSEKFLKRAKKLAFAINSSLNPGDTVIFGEEGIFENGKLLMNYCKLESIIENRSIFVVCDGEKIMILRKIDMVSGEISDFRFFTESKTGRKIVNC